MTLSITTLCTEWHYTNCQVLFILMVSVIMLCIVMLNVIVPVKVFEDKIT